MARLGGAELHFRGDYNSPSRKAARAEFLKVIQKRPTARVVLEALKSDVGPVYSDVLFREFGGASYMRQVVSMASLGIRPRVRPRKLATRQELRKALEAWADRFNLARSGKGRWIYTDAEVYLRRWKTSGILAALLTLASAWFAAGRPSAPRMRPLGSFQEWARTAAGILHFAGIGSFLTNQHEFYEEHETEPQRWELFLDRWYEKFGDREVEVSEVVAVLKRSRQFRESLPDDLAEAYERSKAGLSRKLGWGLRRHVDVRFSNGIVLRRIKSEGSRVATWVVAEWSPD